MNSSVAYCTLYKVLKILTRTVRLLRVVLRVVPLRLRHDHFDSKALARSKRGIRTSATIRLHAHHATGTLLGRSRGATDSGLFKYEQSAKVFELLAVTR